MTHSFDIDRKTAYSVLLRVEIDKSYSNIELNSALKENKVNNPSFVREIVYGVIKYKYLLDFYINSFAKKIDIKDRIILRMGVYQLLYMNSVPAYAAISTSVDLAKKVRYGKDRFINGVLRNIERNRDSLIKPKDDWILYSINQDIYSLILKQYKEEKTKNILISSNETPNLSIRVNLNNCTVDELSSELKEDGFSVEKSKYSSRALIVNGKNLLEESSFKDGKFSVQDESSILSIDTFLEDYNGGNELIIDTCAAPGGKSLAIKEKISKDSHLISCDIYDNKLKLIKKECERLNLSNIDIRLNDGRNLMDEYEFKAHRVLCDVPCSGLGVFRRKPEIKYKDDIDFNDLIETQKEILNTSARYVRDNGVLQYSTCTINKEENEEQIKEFLDNHNDFTLEKEICLLPTDNVDGFYIAKMRRKCR